ncbi:hypothetical protein WNB94_10810 [Aquabacterium sp. A3]|uniref:hypothetical protein n=1 Tax=Aquabacterium sp. A3 TaxID=3132829 RepID=UPI0031192C24
MAKPNYQFEKRQREQQKKLKKVEKAQRKVQATQLPEDADTQAAQDPSLAQNGEPSGPSLM